MEESGQVHASAAFSHGLSPRYRWNRSLGGYQIPPERSAEKKNLLPLCGLLSFGGKTLNPKQQVSPKRWFISTVLQGVKFQRRRTAVGIQVSQGKVPVLNSSPRQEDVWRNGGMSPRILSSAPVRGQHHAAFAPLSEDVPPILFGWAPEPVWML
jgi:hypothetical protein